MECTAEFPFQFGHWRSFDLRLPIKFDLLDERCFFVFVDCFFSSQRQYNMQNLAPQRIFTVVRTLSLYATLLRAFSQLGENSSAGHVCTPFFQNTSFSLFDFILNGCCKVKKTNLTTIFDRVFSSFMYTFYSQFSTRTNWKSVAKRGGCSKNPLYFALRISFIQWGINETVTKLSWTFEENGTSGRFYLFKQKKEHKKWNPLYHVPGWVRGRRKCSQKPAKWTTHVWERGVLSNFTKQASEKNEPS